MAYLFIKISVAKSHEYLLCKLEMPNRLVLTITASSSQKPSSNEKTKTSHGWKIDTLFELTVLIF